jgi:hypothetical protein
MGLQKRKLHERPGDVYAQLEWHRICATKLSQQQKNNFTYNWLKIRARQVNGEVSHQQQNLHKPPTIS